MTAILAMTTFQMQAIAEAAALRIVDCLFAGTLIALFAGLTSRILRRQSSSLRFALWFSALLAIAASPFLSSMIWSGSENVSAGLSRAAITLPGSWAFYVFGVWAGIAAWFLIRLGIGLWRIHALRQTFVAVDLEKLDPEVSKTLNAAGGRLTAVLHTSERVQVPAVIGLAEPVIVVPRWVLDELSGGELNQVLLHELAHLRRRDGWTNLAQQLIKALFFFHPAVWWIERRISLEREMACDDAVLAETASPRAYAECLKHIAEKSLLRRSLALAQAVLGRVRQTSLRVAQILDRTHSRTAKHGWRTAFSLVTLVLVCGLIESNEPHLIAFQDGKPTVGTVAAATYRAPTITPVSFKTAEFQTAEFKTPEAVGSRSVSNPDSHQRPVHALATESNPKNGITPNRRFQVATAHARDLSLLRFASVRQMDAPPGGKMVASETVFVVFQSRGYSPSGQPVCEIEVWHLTVLHPSITSLDNRIPRKQI